jgi:hypothetical protein
MLKGLGASGMMPTTWFRKKSVWGGEEKRMREK